MGNLKPFIEIYAYFYTNSCQFLSGYLVPNYILITTTIFNYWHIA
jgi:hypothetical protein